MTERDPVAARRLGLGVVLLVALLLRAVPLVVADRMVVDVLRYHKVAAHMLDVSWNPYETKRLYPYPPLWVYWETASGWLERHAALPFPLVVRLPILAADLGIVWLLARMGRRRGLGLLPAAAYAVHPVSLLVSGFHGQFDALPLFCLLAALDLKERERQDLSALALAAAIGFKSFPVLVIPAFLRDLGGGRAALRFVTLAVGPVPSPSSPS
jgi:Gpi18-like mannosyltransferase